MKKADSQHINQYFLNYQFHKDFLDFVLIKNTEGHKKRFTIGVDVRANLIIIYD